MEKLIDKCRATHLKQAKAILRVKDEILCGNMIAVDPASKSMGVNIFAQGEHQGHLLIKCTKDTDPIAERLWTMYQQLPELEDIDVMVVELVRPRTGHIYLTWAAALCMIKYAPKHTLELSAGAWQKLRTPDYIKSDVKDSRLIGDFAITICKED